MTTEEPEEGRIFVWDDADDDAERDVGTDFQSPLLYIAPAQVL